MTFSLKRASKKLPRKRNKQLTKVMKMSWNEQKKKRNNRIYMCKYMYKSQPYTINNSITCCLITNNLHFETTELAWKERHRAQPAIKKEAESRKNVSWNFYWRISAILHYWYCANVIVSLALLIWTWMHACAHMRIWMCACANITWAHAFADQRVHTCDVDDDDDDVGDHNVHWILQHTTKVDSFVLHTDKSRINLWGPPKHLGFLKTPTTYFRKVCLFCAVRVRFKVTSLLWYRAAAKMYGQTNVRHVEFIAGIV